MTYTGRAMGRNGTRRPPRALRRAQGGWRHVARVALAWVWRRLMFRTTVVAITGSVGKTTAKECLAAVLAARGPTLKTLDNQNDGPGVPRTLLRLRPWHRFAVIEVGTATPGLVRRSARLVGPHVAIVLNVAHTHTDAYPSPTDVRQAVDPMWIYVIVSLRDDSPVLRAFRIRDDTIAECQVELTGR